MFEYNNGIHIFFMLGKKFLKERITQQQNQKSMNNEF
jgi:hypothetical protein